MKHSFFHLVESHYLLSLKEEEVSSENPAPLIRGELGHFSELRIVENTRKVLLNFKPPSTLRIK